MKKKKAELGYTQQPNQNQGGWGIVSNILGETAQTINSFFNPQQMRQLGNYLSPKFDMNSVEQLRQEELQKIPTAQNGYNIPDYYWLNQNYPPSVYQQIQNQPMGGQLPEVNVYGQAQPQMQYQPAQMQPLTYQPITPIQPLQSPPNVQPTLRPLETAQAQIPYSPLPQIEPLQQAPQIQGDIAVNNQNKGRGFKNPFEGIGLNVGSWITGLTSLASSLAQDNANQKKLRPYDPYVYNNQAYGTNSQSLYANGGSISINPANKGKFTRKATEAGMDVQEFAKHVLSHKEDYSTKTIQQANFAHQANKWHKAEYGVNLPIYDTGGELTADKAKKILHDGTANGKKLTKKQKSFMGWVAGGRKENGGNLPMYNIGEELDLPQETINYLISQGYEFE